MNQLIQENNIKFNLSTKFLVFFLTAVFFTSSTSIPLANEGNLTLTVHKTPFCGCCKKWVTHLEENGFEVEFFRGKTFDGEPIARQVLSGNRFWALQGFARKFLDEKERPELSVKFSTTYKPEISGVFEFEVFSIGLSRIKINGKELVDNWSSQKKGEAFFGFACAPKRNKIKLSKFISN